jgi:hypothetical protein
MQRCRPTAPWVPTKKLQAAGLKTCRTMPLGFLAGVGPRRLCRRGGAARAPATQAARFGAESGSERGSVIANVVPAPSDDATSMTPWCAATISRVM